MSCLGSHSAGTDSSTTPSTWRPSVRSARAARKAGPYFERKVAEGKTKKEAVRSLKRQVSNAVYRQLVLEAERGPGEH